MIPLKTIAEKYEALRSILDERARRRWAAAEALAMGRGGISAVASATGISRPTIYAGIGEIQGGDASIPPASERLRRPGGGRKPRTHHDSTLFRDLEALVESTERGDPQLPLRWTCKSVRKLAEELRKKKHIVSPQLVSELLTVAGYSLQGNRKTREGKQHPDRNAQFEYLAARVQQFHRQGKPVISVDTKKKELLGDFKNSGQEWHLEGKPPKVRVHDFIDRDLGKAIPYGVYDVGANLGWVSVGVDHDTPAFAVTTIRTWWKQMGSRRYPHAKGILITADSGGSNSARARLWKYELQKLADETGLRISVSHLPPGTSKWNKIEHQMFCHITQNWRGRPLVSRETVVNLIGDTTTRTGLKIRAQLDTHEYPPGVAVSDEDMATLKIVRDKFHGDWNYALLPRRSKQSN